MLAVVNIAFELGSSELSISSSFWDGSVAAGLALVGGEEELD